VTTSVVEVARTALPMLKTILVVEDERVVARDIQRSLSDLGYNVPATAASSDQAILLASERCPDLVLMDIRIKGDRDGIETASILRKRFDVPIVYLTAYADESTVARAKQTEPFGYLLKPVKTNELRSAVEIALYKHEMEKRLRDRERWLATTMRSIGDAIVSTDAAGKVNYMNPVAEELTGWKLDDARGRPSGDVMRLLEGRSRSAVPNPLDAALREARTVSVDGVLVREGRGERFISDSCAPILDEGGAVQGAVMVFRDVSERRQLQRQLELSERLATVGTMAAGVAHEVNNPLAYVVGNVTLALDIVRKRRGVADAGDHSWLEEIESALGDAEVGANRVAKIVGDLKAFTRPEPDSREPAELGEVLDWCLDVTGHELGPRTRVVRRFGPPCRVDAPAARLGQVFVNLLINAAHAFDIGRRETNEVIVATRTDEQGRAVVEIQDNGCGMSPEVLERVFEPFFTTKAVGHGTGLGLSVCHGIVGSLGGTIAFESRRGTGTLVRVTLPVGLMATHLESAPVVPEPAVLTGPKGYLMVVDDDPMVRRAIVRLLGGEHTITAPKTSRDALALIVGGLRFDVVLCDLMMPDLSGMDLYGEILRLAPEQARRMVFLSGGAFTARAVEFLSSVPNRQVGKPYQSQELRRLVAQLVVEMGPIKTQTREIGDRR